MIFFLHVELFINITQKSQATNIVLNMHMMIKKNLQHNISAHQN